MQKSTVAILLTSAIITAINVAMIAWPSRCDCPPESVTRHSTFDRRPSSGWVPVEESRVPRDEPEPALELLP